MKTAALLILAAIIAPSLAITSAGARRDAWPIVLLGAAVFAAAFIAIRYLLSGG